MSSIMYHRFKEICPPTKLEDMNPNEIKRDIGIAFEIVGYDPTDLNKAISRAWETTKAEYLFEFVFDVWLVD